MVGLEYNAEYGEEVFPNDCDTSEASNVCLSKQLVENQEKFVFNKQYLKGLLASSVQALNLFSDSKHHDHDQQVSHDDPMSADLAAQFAQLEEDHPVLRQPVCLVVLGADNGARAALVAALLGEPLLPLAAPAGTARRWPPLVVRGACDNFAVMLEERSGLRRQTDLVVRDTERGRLLEPPCLAELGLADTDGTCVWVNVGLNHPLLRGDHVRLVVAPTHQAATVHCFLEDVVPVFLYGTAANCLSEQERTELGDLHRITGGQAVFFAAPIDSPAEPAGSAPPPQLSLHWPHQARPGRRPGVAPARVSPEPAVVARPPPGPLLLQLRAIGYEFSTCPPASLGQSVDELFQNCQLVAGSAGMLAFAPYLRTCLQLQLLRAAHQVNKALNQLLRAFILSAFDMAREIQITPRRLQYARQTEAELFSSVMAIADSNQLHMSQMVNRACVSMRDELLSQAAMYQFRDVEVSETGAIRSARQLQQCTAEIQNLLLAALNRAVAGQLVGSVDYMQERLVGTLQRCLLSLEAHDDGGSGEASNALKQILNSAYSLEISVETSSSVITSLWEWLKQLLDVMPWKTPPCVDALWRRKVATEMLDNINELRLSRVICSQLRDRLRRAHEAFVRSIGRLEAQLDGRLEQTERDRLRMKKLHAPHVARLALQAAAYVDAARFGVPQLAREIGRGQYGVVYSSGEWAGRRDWAVKSVIPPDDRHWNDLSMEYFYTRSLPDHERIVNIRGLVIDYNYSHSRMSAALLLMERLQTDLYLGIQDGLDLPTRLRIALDVAQGARFLHSQGLIHRDIKLKNVLLDNANRGKLTDLGFCKPEAMISGSVVGTPIHMAPELFSGQYDHSVDVYAFGVLLWYILSNDVRMPDVYEQCDNKNDLWKCVKRGLRPSRPRHCSDLGWELVTACWRGEPRHRPLFGVVELKLHQMLDQLEAVPADQPPSPPAAEAPAALDGSAVIPCWS
ncbi:dual serine/threonine and tyrosine protein kinase-like [Amphibalanus amphitrite]|uniref:dual serine/threonine and tyrosine protein kinase-like n=1 Tax=Amphibalanus amphitrite TaxID=1232801 RepID=UPI001C90F3EC|nr:dual serine/threonine and tyrosine protein kinase-like [Amphibalanus amphitrite]